jgi:hypothetical protein
MKNHLLKYAGIALLLALTVTGCRKDAFEGEETLESGATRVKISEGTNPSFFLEAGSGIQKRKLFTVTKAAASQAVNNAAATITLTYAPDLITKYNTDHATGTPAVPDTYEMLPEALYTTFSGVTRTSTGYTINLAPGEFAKSFDINLNFAAFDFSKKYMLAFRIAATGIDGEVTVQNQLLAIVGVKNAYDGVYSVAAGTVTRYTAPGVPAGDALSGNMAGNPDVRLATTGASSLRIEGLNWAAAGGGVGGVDPITLTINPTTNKVTSISSGTAASMKIVPGAVNEYDPATKTFTLNFDWNQTANKREILGLVITYKGSR